MNAFANEFDKQCNTVLTENGGLNFSLDNFDNPLVKSLYTISNYRTDNDNKDSPVKYFQQALKNDETKPWCGKFALMVRDITDGAGERSLGRVLIAKCLDAGILSVDDVVDFVINKRGGRYDDLIYIDDLVTNGFVSDRLVHYVREQFTNDLRAFQNNESISLLAKWLPSINASSATTRKLGRTWAAAFGLSLKNYRKILSKLRNHLDIVERKITSDRFEEIEYSHVPSLAMTRYSNVFRNHDGARFDEYLESVNAGKSKIHTAGTTAPEIVHLYARDHATGQTMWDNRKKYTFTSNVLPVCDVSGSMTCDIGKLTAMDVSIGLSLYLAEANQGVFHGKVMSFSERSDLVDVSKTSDLGEKIKLIDRYGGLNTNVENVLSAVLDLAKSSHCTQQEIPTIAFFSDMEFDPEAKSTYYSQFQVGKSYKALFEKWCDRFNEAGYQFPKMVFWNIAGRSESVPLKANENGLILVSGYNENLVKMVISDQYDPWNALKETLVNPRYNY